MTMVLSQLAPQYYTKEELEKIEKIKQNLHKVEGEKVDNKIKYFSSDDCCTSYEERRVKSKIPKNSVLKKHANHGKQIRIHGATSAKTLRRKLPQNSNKSNPSSSSTNPHC